MISTRDLSLLPDVNRLRRTIQSMAMLDAIVSPEWQYRYYSFNSGWNVGEQMASMRNGCGDDLFALFDPTGCWIKGFAHESPMSPYRQSPKRVCSGIFDAVPHDFSGCLCEPAFKIEETTFCIWRRYTDHIWQVGPIEYPAGHPDPDGSRFLLSNLDGRPESYQVWATDYYERELDLAVVDHVYRHQPLTSNVVALLNPELSLAELIADINEIGYPEVNGDH